MSISQRYCDNAQKWSARLCILTNTGDLLSYQCTAERLYKKGQEVRWHAWKGEKAHQRNGGRKPEIKYSHVQKSQIKDRPWSKKPPIPSGYAWIGCRRFLPDMQRIRLNTGGTLRIPHQVKISRIDAFGGRKQWLFEKSARCMQASDWFFSFERIYGTMQPNAK